jgi:hypothetical protein
MKQIDAGAILALFNEKVARLASLSFFEKARGGGAIVEFRRDAGWDSLFVGPDKESIEALVLTLHLFMQNNDRLSLQNMRNLYVSLPVSPELVDDFSLQCDQLNRFLDSATNLSIEEGCQLTHRDILEIFVYGSYAHVNARHRTIFEGIRTTTFFPIFQDYLVKAVEVFRRCVVGLKAVNTRALAEL